MDGDSVNSPPVSALTYIEDIGVKRQTELKNKVLRRLVDATSPTSEAKRLTFNAIVNGKVGIAEIISITSGSTLATPSTYTHRC